MEKLTETLFSRILLLLQNSYQSFLEWRAKYYSIKVKWVDGSIYYRIFTLEEHVALLEYQLNAMRKHMEGQDFLNLVFEEVKKVPELQFVTFEISKSIFFQFLLVDKAYWFCLADWKTNNNRSIYRKILKILRQEGYTQVSARRKTTEFTHYKFFLSRKNGNRDLFAHVGENTYDTAEFTNKVITRALQKDVSKVRVFIE